MNHIPHLDQAPLTPAERFERSLWEADKAIQNAKDQIADMVVIIPMPGQFHSTMTGAMLLAMLQIAGSTLASVKALHEDTRRKRENV